MTTTRHRVAIIGRTGKGDYGHGVDIAWRDQPGVEIVAVADENEKGRAAALARTEAKRGYADYRQMLQSERPTIVSIATRWIDQHHEMLMACAESGCHVFMEKPFCRNLQEADEIVRAFEMRHLKLAIAHTTRHSPVLKTVQRLVHDGQIGEVLEARARGKEDRRGGGEDFWVLGSHLVDLTRAFFGDPLDCRATVSARGRRVTAADVYQGAEGIGPLAGDAVEARYSLPNQVAAYVASRREKGGSPSRFGLQIFGTKGVIEMLTGYGNPAWILQDPSWSPGRSKAKWQIVTSAGIDQPEPNRDLGNEAGNHAGARDLVEAIETDRQPKCSLYDARWTVEMIAAAFESHRLRQTVTFPLATRHNPLTLL